MSASDKVESADGAGVQASKDASNHGDPNESTVKSPKPPAAAAGRKRVAARPADVGRALRSVYDDTLRETIPSDLTDLLGRLG